MEIKVFLLMLFGVFAIDARFTQNGGRSRKCFVGHKLHPSAPQNGNKETVHLEIYYDLECFYSKAMLQNEVTRLMKNLRDYVSLYTNPYGFTKRKEENGTVVFDCSLGPDQCYAEKLHACAIHHFKDNYYDFNACLFLPHAKDENVRECGLKYKLDYQTIINCAKGTEGTQYLKEFGEESDLIGITEVPYVLVNKFKPNTGGTLSEIVCDTLKNPPDVCNDD